MTRKSKRELERALEELGPGTAWEWVTALLQEGATLSDREGPATDALLVVAGSDYDLYADPADVPEWIDVDDDLPVPPGGAA